MNLHHINIKGPKELIAQEQKFFVDILGLHAGWRPELTSNGVWLYANEQPIVHLTESDVHFKNENPSFFDHVAFQSSKLNQLIQLIK